MQTIPYSEDFERALIVGLLTDPSQISQISSVVSSDDFFKVAHKEIVSSVYSLGPDNADSLAVAETLSPETKGYFETLVADSDNILPSLSNLKFYAENIKDKSNLRNGIDLGRNIVAACYEETSANEIMQQLEDMFAKFLQERVHDSRATLSTKDSFQEFYASLGAIDVRPVIKTGFTELDLILHRLEELIVVAARPGVGKTSFALNIIKNVLPHRPVLFFSLEQTRQQIFERWLSIESEIPLEDIRVGAVLKNNTDMQILEATKNKLVREFEHFHIDDTSPVTTQYITSIARQKKFEWGEMGLIVVDYLNMIQISENKNKTDAVGDATIELRNLAKELGCPLLLLAQLNRASEQANQSGKRSPRRPELSDLRSSGDIEQSADIVMFLYRDSYYEPAGLEPEDDTMEIIVRKNRNGRQGIINLQWLPRYVKFKD